MIHYKTICIYLRLAEHTFIYLCSNGTINADCLNNGILAKYDLMNEANCKREAAQIDQGDDNFSGGVNGDTVSDHVLLIDLLYKQQLLLEQLDALSEMFHGGARKSYVHDVVCERCSGQGHRSGVCPYVVCERFSCRGHACDGCPSGRRFGSGRRSRFVRGQGRRDANVSLNGHPPSE
jgi:hypothetical protein